MLTREDTETCKDLADSYLDIQKTRVAMELRLFQLENRHLVKVGLCEKIIVNDDAAEPLKIEDQTVDDEGNLSDEEGEPTSLLEEEEQEPKRKKKRGIKFVRANSPIEKELKPIKKLLKTYAAAELKNEKQAGTIDFLEEWNETVPEEYKERKPADSKHFLDITFEGLDKKLRITREKIKLALAELAQRNESFKMFKERFKELSKIEEGILEDSEGVFGGTLVWQYFKRVKGLGSVATLTMLGNIDVFTSPTIGHVWSNFGLIPGKSLKRGESSNFNPHVRARILGVICNNLIKSGDPYYVGIYAIKKSYHQNRPDLIARQEQEKKSWNMHMHRMSYRVMGKLLVSHAYELIREDLMKSAGTKQSIASLHRNSIPIKPENKFELEKILLRYQENHNRMLAKLKPLWEVKEAAEAELKKAREIPVDAQGLSTVDLGKLERAEKKVKKLTDDYYQELSHPTIIFER